MDSKLCNLDIQRLIVVIISALSALTSGIGNRPREAKGIATSTETAEGNQGIASRPLEFFGLGLCCVKVLLMIFL